MLSVFLFYCYLIVFAFQNNIILKCICRRQLLLSCFLITYNPSFKFSLQFYTEYRHFTHVYINFILYYHADRQKLWFYELLSPCMFQSLYNVSFEYCSFSMFLHFISSFLSMPFEYPLFDYMILERETERERERS